MPDFFCRANHTMKFNSLLGAFFAILFSVHSAFAGGDAKKGVEFFESKIRPVLSKYCYECHSTQSKRLKAGLLLDSKAGMLQGGDSGPVLVPGKAKESLLVKALAHDGPTKMPSQSTKLSNEIIADFVKWIEMGAPDPRDGKVVSRKKEIDIEKGRRFWSFQPLVSVAPPNVKDGSWVRTPIDRFILAKLEEKGLTPNAPANWEKLLRRAYFDLHGLPPTVEEIQAFSKEMLSAKPQAAYEAMIDRLLESPRFGERWARHWLDTVRFAESGGYEFDGNRPNAFHYRDFVIKAMNDDMPFDQFLRWQIAGDQLVPGNLQAVAATGFLVAGSYPGQTTSKTLALIRYDHLDDMISTLGTSMLGLSLGCARCHEHKYDPIPQEDYYRLISSLGRTDSANLKVNIDLDNYKKAKVTFDSEHAPLLKARDSYEQGEGAKFLDAFWTANKDKAGPAWLTLVPTEAKAKSGALQVNADGSLSLKAKTAKSDTFTIAARTMQKKIKAIRVEALADTGANADFVLSEITIVATPTKAPPKGKIKPITVKLKPGQATAADAKFPLAAAVDGNLKTGWSIGKATSKDHAATFEFDGNIGFDGGTNLAITLTFSGNAIARPRLAITTVENASLTDAGLPQAATELLTILRDTQGKLKPERREITVDWLRKLDAKTDAIYQKIDAHAKSEPQPKLVTVFAAQSGRGGPVNFLVRGEPEKKREVSNPGFVQVLMNNAEKDKHWLDADKTKLDPRVGLANWITDKDQGAGHLAARVMVNRLWQHHMGKGIVATPNDFGVQGDAPTHPELLDYLASELIKNGWRLKPIHKLIMTSAVYLQSNEINPSNMKTDPANKLWWRRPTRRLEAEAIRDSLLAVGGNIDLKMYGAGTLDANNPRRSIYLTVKRSQMIPFLTMFDVPEALQGIGERSVTTVPTQSLAFMNSPLVRGTAQKLAARVRTKDANVEPAIEQAYQIALARMPSQPERDRMRSFIERQAESYGKSPAARDLALTDFCQVLICLNEFIYVD